MDVDVDVQRIIHKTGSQTPLVRFACSLSASIDLNRPYKLSSEESKSLNWLPVIRARQDTVNKHKWKWNDCKAKLDHASMACQAAFGHLDEGALSKQYHHIWEKLELFQDQTMEAKQKYDKSVCELCNEKQQQRNQWIRENLEWYWNEQPVINLECQLAGKLVNTKVMEALEHKGFMPPQHLTVIDATLSMPGATLEAEYQCWINMINAMTAFCPVEEGRPTPWPSQSCCQPVPDNDKPCPPAKQQQHFSEDKTEITLRQAMESVQIKSPEE